MEDNSLFSHLRRSQEQKREDRDTRSLLAGATPLLVGLLAGNTGTAMDIAGTALLDEDQRQLKEDSDLMSYLRKKEAKSSAAGGLKKRYQQAPYEDDAGNIKLGTFDTFTGKLKKGDEIKGFAPKIGTDPRTGEWARVGKGKAGERAKIVESAGVDKAPLTVKQEKDVTAAQKEFNSSIKKIRESQDATQQFLSAIEQKNPIAHSFAQTALAKMAEGGGRLSDQDVNRLGGTRSIRGKLQQYTEFAKTGRLTKENIDFMKQLGSAIKRANDVRIAGRAKRFSKLRSKALGFDIMPYIYEGSSAGPSKGDVVDGYRFKGGDPNDKTKWEKVK